MRPRQSHSSAGILLGLLALALVACGRNAADTPGRDALPKGPGGAQQPRALEPAAAQEAIPDAQTQQALSHLPALSELEAGGLSRGTSQTDFELLPFQPLRLSAEGAVWQPGSLVLSGAVASSGSAWALYSLSGFSNDGTVVPDGLTLFRSQPVWLALADFSAGRWRILDKSTVGNIPLSDGASLVSPAGVFYVAVIAHDLNASIAALNVSANLDLPGGPTAVLTVPSPLYAGVPADFDAAGSDGAGSSIIECLYDFGDGTPAETTFSAAETISHVYADPGDYQVNLQVTTDGSRIASASFPVTVAPDPTFPLAQLNLLSQQPTAEWPVSFNAAGSTGGSGNISSISYDWGDGSPAGEAALPDDVLTHIYDSPGSKTVTLTVVNDLGKSRMDTVQIDCALPQRDLLVVYNADDPESIELKNYYMNPETGRAIDPQYELALPLGAAVGETIPRDDGAGGAKDYVNDIREPLKLHINNSGYKESLKYILLFSGVPHRISGESEFSYTDSTCSSVDSELCTLFSDGTYPLAGALWNESDYQAFQQPAPQSDSFYIGLGPNNDKANLDRQYSFSHGTYKVTSSTGTQFDLDYLVGRLDAYNLQDAKAIVDRALAADTSGLGWVIYDSSPGSTAYDTMADPVWPHDQAADAECGDEILTLAGHNHFLDLTNTRIIGQGSDNLPAGSVDNVIAYAGWGVNHSGGSWPSGAEYILDDLLFSYLPGCAWISYESFNATDFSSVDPDLDRSDINRRGQGQICDFLHRGGTVAMGHAWEPFTIAVGDERNVHYRYAVKGDRWIEAAYKGLRTLSWQDVVVGDPLCTVK